MELLLSFSIWVLMTTGFIPLYIHVNRQSAQISEELEATRLLYEIVEEFIIEGKKENEQQLKRNDKTYSVIWNEGDEPGSLKVCIQYENNLKESVQKCETIE